MVLESTCSPVSTSYTFQKHILDHPRNMVVTFPAIALLVLALPLPFQTSSLYTRVSQSLSPQQPLSPATSKHTQPAPLSSIPLAIPSTPRHIYPSLRLHQHQRHGPHRPHLYLSRPSSRSQTPAQKISPARLSLRL